MSQGEKCLAKKPYPKVKSLHWRIMTNQNKLSRREAIKILGAATGASLLANIPAKWSKPEVTGSTLPAFAQTSCIALFVAVTNADGLAPSVVGIVSVIPNVDTLSSATWYCQPGCNFMTFSLTAGTFAEMLFETPAESVTFTLNAGNSPVRVLVDLASGAIGINNSPNPVGACAWRGSSFAPEEGGATTTFSLGK